MVNKPKTRYARPPISEVVCGFVFEPLEIDPMDFGVYRDLRREDYPRHELRDPILDGPILISYPPVRVWLISKEDDFVLQIQHDRFYMNWRGRGGQYPRFSDRGGEPRGLKTKALGEYEKFALFCEGRCGQRPSLKRLELTKIDVLKKGLHFSDADDLGRLLKVGRVFQDIQATESPSLHLQLREDHDGERLNLQIRGETDAVRIETRLLFEPGEDMGAAFDRANRRANEIFFGLLVKDEAAKRFKEEIDAR